MKTDSVLKIKIVSGLACDLPIFSYEKNVFKYDSYGQVPPNWPEFDNNRGYGLCGSYGETPKKSVVLKAIRLFNIKNEIGLCTKEVVEIFKKSNVKLKIVKFGFK